MNLRETLKKKTPLTTWIPFQPDMLIQIEYVDFPEFNRMVDASEADSGAALPGEKIQEYDEDKYNVELAKKIKGLKGFTLRKVLDLTNYETPPGADLDSEVEFCDETLIFLIEELYKFKKLTRESIMQIWRFKEVQLSGDLGNSKDSQGSASE